MPRDVKAFPSNSLYELVLLLLLLLMLLLLLPASKRRSNDLGYIVSSGALSSRSVDLPSAAICISTLQVPCVRAIFVIRAPAVTQSLGLLHAQPGIVFDQV